MTESEADETEIVPWCPDCDAFSIPTPRGNCGECGTTVEYREGES